MRFIATRFQMENRVIFNSIHRWCCKFLILFTSPAEAWRFPAEDAAYPTPADLSASTPPASPAAAPTFPPAVAPAYRPPVIRQN